LIIVLPLLLTLLGLAVVVIFGKVRLQRGLKYKAVTFKRVIQPKIVSAHWRGFENWTTLKYALTTDDPRMTLGPKSQGTVSLWPRFGKTNYRYTWVENPSVAR
jgi:hypothetical protein